jgi:hypothetical protein
VKVGELIDVIEIDSFPKFQHPMLCRLWIAGVMKILNKTAFSGILLE